jgi:hypothetical protein
MKGYPKPSFDAAGALRDFEKLPWFVFEKR